MKPISRLAIVLVAALAIAGPVVAAENWPDSFSAYIAGVRKTIKTVDMDGFLAVVKDPSGALLIDVRDENEFKAGNIPGTINISRGLLEFQIWRRLGYPKDVDMNTRIYLHCATGGRCTLAAESLQRIGFTNVTAAVFELAAWQKKGYPFQK